MIYTAEKPGEAWRSLERLGESLEAKRDHFFSRRNQNCTKNRPWSCRRGGQGSENNVLGVIGGALRRILEPKLLTIIGLCTRPSLNFYFFPAPFRALGGPGGALGGLLGCFFVSFCWVAFSGAQNGLKITGIGLGAYIPYN